MTVISGLACLPLWNTIAARFGGFAWVVYPLVALGASLGLVLAFVVGFIVFSIFRNWHIQFEKPSLTRARKVSRLEGEVERSGPVTIWWCSPEFPVPMVIEQMALARERFEPLIDVLREGDERFTPTAAWALESISGLAWGSSADRWEESWAGRDPAAASGCETAGQA